MDKIEHHHLLLRVETELCPKKSDKVKISKLIHTLLNDIKMEPLGLHEIFYVDTPKYNEGLTAIQAIQTSHIAFHFWKNPAIQILKSKDSRCLLQLDIYNTNNELDNYIDFFSPKITNDYS
jgi:S-adenosylmethionine/arginine decarboxylase-like enzyme